MNNNNNDDDIPIGKRDIYLEQINKQLIAKQKLLRSKEDELEKKRKDNEYLNHVYEEYKHLSTKTQKEKENLIDAMERIINHLDDIIKNNKLLTNEDLTEIQEEKMDITNLLKELKKQKK